MLPPECARLASGLVAADAAALCGVLVGGGVAVTSWVLGQLGVDVDAAGRVVSLTIPSVGLRSLSPAIAGMERLETLTLIDNPAVSDVAALCSLPALTGLSISGCGVSALPDLRCLPRLEGLDVSGNPLGPRAVARVATGWVRGRGLPEWLGGMPTLARVGVSDCGVEALPAFGPALTMLFASGNAITSLPPAAWGWRELQLVDLARNDLGPAAADPLGTLPALVIVRLSNNPRLASLPPGWAAPNVRLRELEAAGCGLAEPLFGVGGANGTWRLLPALELLGIDQNPALGVATLQRLDGSALVKLHVGHVGDADAQRLGGINTTALEELSLTDCPGLTRLPSWVAGPRNLTTVLVERADLVGTGGVELLTNASVISLIDTPSITALPATLIVKGLVQVFLRRVGVTSLAPLRAATRLQAAGGATHRPPHPVSSRARGNPPPPLAPQVL